MTNRWFFTLFVFALTAWPAQAQEEISWETLAGAELVQKGSQWVPEFGPELKGLSGKTVQLAGFIIPLEQAQKQQNFVLGANPVQGCQYCMPGGPTSFVEVKTVRPVDFSWDMVTITGRLELVENNQYGLFYRLVDARRDS